MVSVAELGALLAGAARRHGGP
ncbi:MAG: hypothetical protein QOF44_2024, partial [Streptomyces sp.]|nr:hypothetical protein [Streptomyces sp.]